MPVASRVLGSDVMDVLTSVTQTIQGARRCVVEWWRSNRARDYDAGIDRTDVEQKGEQDAREEEGRSEEAGGQEVRRQKAGKEGGEEEVASRWRTSPGAHGGTPVAPRV
jgi:hypothetical protein